LYLGIFLKNICESCKVQNKVFGWRDSKGSFQAEYGRDLILKYSLGYKIFRIELSVNEFQKTLCQRCRKIQERELKKKKSEQLSLFP